MSKNHYNHCQRCHKSLGLLNWLKFWQKPKLCPECQQLETEAEAARIRVIINRPDL